MNRDVDCSPAIRSAYAMLALSLSLTLNLTLLLNPSLQP